MTPYNREITAYACLLHANVRDYVHRVYGTAKHSVSGWGLKDVAGDTSGEYYGILMEWVEGSEELTEENITIDHAVCLSIGLHKIDEAGVVHDDANPRNKIIIPGTTRAVWIDFSCSQVEVDEHLEQEMYGPGAVPVEMVGFPRVSIRIANHSLVTV